ncbi:MAG: amino acid ABC transporter permease [Candidatus Thorarchaeota archaeon]
MFFQIGSEFTNIVNNLILAITIPIIFIFGTYSMKWYAKKKRWTDSIKIAIIINLTLLIIISPINFLIFFIFSDILVTFTISLVISIIVGTILVMKFYNKKFKDSVLFDIVIQLIIFPIIFILSLIVALILILVFFQSFVFNAIIIIWDIFTLIILNGLAITLYLTALGLLGGFIIGLSLALMRVYGGKELNWFSSGYEKLFRGIPILILIFIFAFGMPDLFWYILDPLNRIQASVILALALRSGAYQSQIFRGAILSVDLGQMEAAQALGMSRLKAIRHVLLPQALRLAVPGWSNEYAVVIKDTSFAFEVGIIEMTKWAYRYGTNHPELWIVSMGVLAVTYFFFTFPVTKLFGERQVKKLKQLGIGGD